MATVLKLRSDIKKLKQALESKAIKDSIKAKLREQITKAEKELDALQKPKAAAKKATSKTSTTASQKPTLDRIQKLIKGAKYKIYQGKGVDLKKDASQPAFASGRRVSKGLKANQVSGKGNAKSNKGNVYYEYRPNRVDVKQPPKRYPKLAKGGLMDRVNAIKDKYARGGKLEVGNMVTVDDSGYVKLFTGFDISKPAKIISKGKTKRNGKVVYFYGLETADGRKPFNNAMESMLTKVSEDGGYMAKGGGISSQTTYVPNRDVSELSVILNKQLKTIKGTDIVDGVYVKNSALSKLKARVAAKKSAAPKTTSGVDDIYAKMVAKAKEYKIEDKDISENLKKEHIKSLVNAGLDLKDLYVIYFGVQTLSPTTDLSYDSSGIMSLSADYVKRIVDRIVTAVKGNKFEIGLKYPEISWASINKKYAIQKEPKIIKGGVTDFTTSKENYVYAIYNGNNVVLGTSVDRERYVDGKLQKDDYYKRDAPLNGNFKGGYWGIVTSSKEVMYDIAKMILSQKNGYVKDIELFINRLGGVDADDLDLNKVEYEDGGYMENGGDTNDLKYLNGKSIYIYSMGVDYPSRAVIAGVKVTDERFSIRDVTLQMQGGGEEKFPLDKLDSFLKGKTITCYDGKEKYEIKLIKGFSEGGYMAGGGNLPIENSGLVGKSITIKLPNEVNVIKDIVVLEYENDFVGKKGIWSKKYVVNKKEDGGYMEGGGQADGKNGYIAFYKGKRIEVYADSMYQAQLKAAKLLNAKNSYDVSVSLAELDGKPHLNSTMMAKGGLFDGGSVLSKTHRAEV